MTDKYIKSKEELEDCLRLEVCVYVSDRNYTSRMVLCECRKRPLVRIGHVN